MQARAQQVLQDSVADVARRLRSAIAELLELPDEELAAAVAEPSETDQVETLSRH